MWRILLVLIVIGLTLTTVDAVTGAYFTDNEQSLGNTITCWFVSGVSVTRTFTPSSTSDTSIIDSEIAAGSPNDNRGTDTTMSTRHPSGGDLRALVQFDISSLPRGSTDVSGTLTLRCTSAGSQTKSRSIGAYRITNSWVEGNGSTIGVTWISRDKSVPTNWNTAGGDFAPAATATTTVTASAQFYTWDVGTDLASFLAGSPTSNYGWLLKDDGSTDTNTQKYFATKNNSTASNRPKLSVTFTAPWDSYQDSARTAIRNTFTSSYKTVYMKGTGFKTGTYNVAYYDAGASGGQKVTTESGIIVVGDGILLSYYFLPTVPTAIAGTWHALVQPASGYSLFPTDYNSATSAPDTYGLLTNDSFTVEPSALSP